MNAIEIIAKKRDASALSPEEILFIVSGYTDGAIPDYQFSAFLMACFINQLSEVETASLTEAMLLSGQVMDLSEIPGIKVDKHSTGGVGDKTSLIVAPICASLGVPIPMISGRGLGHSGGTLDKLESIPGFNVNLSLTEFIDIVRDLGLCLIGQTEQIAPADKKIYALRDVTATVENKSLITASIMSKKLAEGIDALVLDVKMGKGAFMKKEADAEALAKLLIATGRRMGKRVTALITDMNQPLGGAVGNSLEIIESVEILSGVCRHEQRDLLDLSLELAAHMLVSGGRVLDLSVGRDQALGAIQKGSALSKFRQLIKRQGGDPSSIDDFSLLPSAKHSHILEAPAEGYLYELDAFFIGRGAVLLGAGRETLDSVIDPAVGVLVKRKIGDRVMKNDPLLIIQYNSKDRLELSLPLFQKAIKISSQKPDLAPLIKKTLGG